MPVRRHSSKAQHISAHIYAAAKQAAVNFVMSARLASDYEPALRATCSEFSFHPDRPLTKQLELVDTAWRLQDALFHGSTADSYSLESGTHEGLLIRDAMDAVQALAHCNVSLNHLVPANCRFIARVLENREALHTAIARWDEVNLQALIRTVANYPANELRSKLFLMEEAALGNDVKMQFVTALHNLENTLTAIVQKGLTPAALEQLAHANARVCQR